MNETTKECRELTTPHCYAIDRVAIKSAEDDKIVSLPRPNRHCNVIAKMVTDGYQTPIKGVQGFLTFGGQFVDRYIGRRRTERYGQLLERATDSSQLCSEDIF